jgi:hypothetical protein
MGKIATTWQLMKDSWGVLMRDKELLLFPVASGVATFLVLLTFICRSSAPPSGARAGTSDTCSTSCCSATTSATSSSSSTSTPRSSRTWSRGLRGGEPTIGQSLGAATACIPQIAAWAIVSATVGVILRWLSERAGFLGQIALALVGFAWTLVTTSWCRSSSSSARARFDAIGDSKDLLRNTWGQQIVSGLGYGLIGFLLSLPALVVLIGAIVAGASMQSFAAFGALGRGCLLYVVRSRS